MVASFVLELTMESVDAKELEESIRRAYVNLMCTRYPVTV